MTTAAVDGLARAAEERVGLRARLLAAQLPHWQLRLGGAVLVLCAAASFVAAGWQDRRTRVRLPEPELHMLPLPLTLGVAFLLVILSLMSELTFLFR